LYFEQPLLKSSSVTLSEIILICCWLGA